LRDRQDEIHSLGAELAIVGNGAPNFAAAFREDQKLDGPLLVDPELRAYRAAGLRRGRVEVLSPRLGLNALRALSRGYTQGSVQGDPWQLGGVFVFKAGGALTYRYASREAGDHPPVTEIVAALDVEAPEVDEAVHVPAWQRRLGQGLSRIVDPTVFLSFDRTGFAIHSLSFDPEDLEVDLAGRRVLVSGANSGIGFETALTLADLGSEVVLLCRNPERGEDAAARIREQTGSRGVSLEQVDMSDLDSVRSAARRLAAGPVDVLVHNAGVLPDERVLTAQGLELTFATHVVGPHLLTRLLQPRLEESRDARVVWVSSGGMYTRRLDLGDLDWSHRAFDGVAAYAQTKRMQVVMAKLWAEELRAAGVCVNAMHPGWADTPAVRTSLPGFYRVARSILRTPAEGADTVVWLAASAGARQRSGSFFFDREPRSPWWLPFTRESDDQRRALWALCEKLVAPWLA